MASYNIEIKGLERLKSGFKQSPSTVTAHLIQAIKTSVNIIRPIMALEAPKASGKLKRNIYARASGLKGEVGPNLTVTPYAIFVHEGTRAHEIRPKQKKALYWKGALHPVKRVMHPGTSPNKFVERTADRMTEPVQRIFTEEINRAINEIANIK